MARLICLANSIRENARCVAGINTRTMRWVRPVPQGGGAIPVFRTHIQGRLLSVLDVFELDLSDVNPGTRFQRENRVIENWDWRLVGHKTPQEMLRYCDDSAPILYNAFDRVDPAQLTALASSDWKSLQLVHASRVTFSRDSFDPRGWRAQFQDAGGAHYNLKVTDPVARDRLNRGKTLGPNCLLTVSLAEPWARADGSKAAFCYKLVAAVIQL